MDWRYFLAVQGAHDDNICWHKIDQTYRTSGCRDPAFFEQLPPAKIPVTLLECLVTTPSEGDLFTISMLFQCSSADSSDRVHINHTYAHREYDVGTKCGKQLFCAANKYLLSDTNLTKFDGVYCCRLVALACSGTQRPQK